MRALPLALLLALAGCVGADEDGAGEAWPWVVGDAWTYDLTLAGGEAVDTWTVLGAADLDGRPVLQVQSATHGAGHSLHEVGTFDARTLALLAVDGNGTRTTFDPGETWILPPADRDYVATVTRTDRDGTATTTVDVEVRHVGEETVETEAGTLVADRFEVRKVLHAEGGSREQRATWWWAPNVANVVRQDVDGATVRLLASYALADGPRTAPGGTDP